MPVVTPTPCKIVHVALEEGPAPLELEPRYRAACVFFSCEGVVLGHRVLHANELPLSAAQMWTLGAEAILPSLAAWLMDEVSDPQACIRHLVSIDPLERFGCLWRQRSALPLAEQASVVVCTHERPEALHRCLDSLTCLDIGAAEIVVVDNAPRSRATRDVVEAFPGVRYEAEPHPGLSRARNCGIELARGSIVAFTDDDVEVSPHWLRELLRPFRDPQVMCTTGLVIPAELETMPQALFEHWQSFGRGYQEKVFDAERLGGFHRRAAAVWEIGAGANMAVRKQAFTTLGGFDSRLGAGASGCSEDSEFWYRVLAAGGRCVYTPAALVHHYHRADARALQHQMRMYSRGHLAALLLQFARYRHSGILRRLFFELPKHHAVTLAYSLLLPDGLSYWMAGARGSIEGLFYLLRPRSSAVPTASPAAAPARELEATR
jgi:GT2 family glycosyltransferase